MIDRVAVLLLTSLLAAQQQELPMHKRTVFSPVAGQILVGGKPVAELEVVQRFSWLSVDDGEAHTKTDAQGRFAFPAVSVRKLRAPKDVLIEQDIEVRYQGKQVSLWNLIKQNTDLEGELGGPIELVADLDQPSRELKIPVAADSVAVLNGVATPRLPYLEKWERIRGQVTAQGVGRALKAFLASAEGMKGLSGFFPAIGDEHLRVAEVVSVQEVQLSDGFLFAEPESGHYAVREAPRFVGFTTRAQVGVRLESGEELTAKFFCWNLLLPLDAEGKPKYQATISDRWEVDTRDFLRQRAERALVPARVTALVRSCLQTNPGEDFLSAFGAKTASALSIEAAELKEVQVQAAKDDWALLSVFGQARGRAGKREAQHSFQGHLSVALASLGKPEYQLAAGQQAPRFEVYRFQVSLETDKKVYELGEKIVLIFRVENLMDSEQRFLKWHTPFEGFRNDFLDLQRIGGATVRYQGILASRAPPGEDSYLKIGPRQTATSQIEITEAYPVAERGDYVLRYKGLPQGILTGETRFSVR